MAIKTIRFRPAGAGTTTVADGADGILVPTAGPDPGQFGLYADATTISGIRAGWVAQPDFGLANDAGISGDAKFGLAQVVRATGATTRVLRIDRAAGTFPVWLQIGMAQGGTSYVTPRNRILNTSGAELFAQSGPSRNADGDSVPMQINTDGTKQLVGAADAGVSVTTTGSYWDIEIRPGTEFQNRLSFISFDDGVTGGGLSASVLRRRRRMACSSSFF
jgi:hypothetical protein